jgi:hypothetical protein
MSLNYRGKLSLKKVELVLLTINKVYINIKLMRHAYALEEKEALISFK